ncbi:MAG TPA: hypothetical protein VNU70_00590 [Puia sp.]|jgi:hypothetical protein|nr:hypothetical protein [Puia sp.]
MYTLLNRLGWSGFLAREAPALLLSWILAEVFYKFGSFTLETGAFLVTWYITGFALHKVFAK